jgi:hypothetical protein
VLFRRRCRDREAHRFPSSRSPLLPLFALASAFAFALILAPGIASAQITPRPLPFTYGYATNGEGATEIEQYVDLTPAKGTSPTGDTRWFLASQFQTEFEYGITNHLELGLYVTFAPQPPDLTGVELTEGTGAKQRLRYRIAEEGEWPLDVALYGELVENDHEIELEGKIILQKRIGRLLVASNLWAEFERYYTHEKAVVFNPTLGATYQISPVVNPGIEAWMRAELSSPVEHPVPFGHGPHVLVGPAMMLNFGSFWWSTGVYLRATDYGRSPEPGDAPGAVWARMIVGLQL